MPVTAFRRRRGQLTRLHTAAALAHAAGLLAAVIEDSTRAELGLWARTDVLARLYAPGIAPSPPRILAVPAAVVVLAAVTGCTAASRPAVATAAELAAAAGIVALFAIAVRWALRIPQPDNHITPRRATDALTGPRSLQGWRARVYVDLAGGRPSDAARLAATAVTVILAPAWCTFRALAWCLDRMDDLRPARPQARQARKREETS